MGTRSKTQQNGTQEETLDQIRSFMEKLEQVIVGLRAQVSEFEEEQDELEKSLHASKTSLDKFLNLRNTIVHTYSVTGQQQQLFPDWLSDDGQRRLAGLPLGEAMEHILMATGREMTQEELTQALEGAGLPLGRLAGRKLHAASLHNARIRKVRAGTYVYVAPAEELVPA